MLFWYPDMPAPVAIALTDEEREEFRRRCRSGKTPARLKERLSIVLLADEGLSNNEIAERLPFSAKKLVGGGTDSQNLA